jgi:hypothetical protein
MSQVTELASGQLTATETITVELIEADQTAAVIIVRWPSKPSVFHTHRFPSAADSAARTFATAVVKLAQIKREGLTRGLGGLDIRPGLSQGLGRPAPYRVR